MILAVSLGIASYGGAVAGAAGNLKSALRQSGRFEAAGPEEREDIAISAVGDCTLGYDASFGYRGSFDDYIDRYGLEYPFKNVVRYFREDDVTIANLEGTFTDGGEKAVKKFRFRGKPEYARILSLSSIEAVNLANNHTHDYLDKGYADTRKYLKKDGIGYFGNGYKYIRKVRGTKVGFLGYPGWYDSGEIESGIRRDIAGLKKTCSVVVVNFHWGSMYQEYPDVVQQKLGRYSIDCGADLVVGHHPHIIQGIEKYRDRFILYSVGNFSYGGHKNPPDKDTFIFRGEFTVGGESVKSAKAEITPCSISSAEGRNNYQPRPLCGGDRERVMNRLKSLSSKLKYGYDFKDQN